MVVGWEWDETLFAGTAPYYERGRLPYAPGWTGVLGEVLELDGRGRLLDAGCGPGVVGLGLLRADAFSELVGVDPDGGMIAEAERRTGELGLAERARWLRARAEDLTAAELGTFNVVTFGQSFHWMDRDLVATIVKGLLRSGGAVVHLADLKTETRTVGGLPYPAAPYAAIDQLVGRYLGPERRAGQDVLRYGTPGNEEAVFARTGFSGPERHAIPGGQALERTVDDVVAWTHSMSWAAPHLFGERAKEFEADLRGLLLEASAAGIFSERQPSTDMRIWRPEVGT